MANEPAGNVRLLLRLYVAGRAPNSLRAIANARAICEQHFASAHEIEIIDMLEHPQRALDDRIVVTPTLIKVSPPPALRVVGALNDTEQVLMALSGS